MVDVSTLSTHSINEISREASRPVSKATAHYIPAESPNSTANSRRRVVNATADPR